MPKPDGPQFLYHEAHLKDRESIRSGGLRPGKEFKYGDGTTQPGGVYLSPSNMSEYSSSMHDASHYGYDRWRVNVSGMNVQTDPTQPNSARFTQDAVTPDRIKLAKKGHPNWEKHI